MSRTVVIAEAGVNHNGNLELALELVEASAMAGADFVKFQTFTAERLATRAAPKTGYQSRATPESQSHFEMLRELELTDEAHFILKSRAQELGLGFLSTPFDLRSLDFLAKDLGLPTIKVGSGDLATLPLLVNLGRLKRDMILSTGMSTMREVIEGLGAYVFGLLSGHGDHPDVDRFAELAMSQQGLELLRAHVRLLHCTSEYPAPDEHMNLAAMETLRTATGLRVGLSDHSLGIAVPIAAVALGACIIEKHITLDTALSGPDHSASLDPPAFAEMVRGIRSVEAALGHGRKEPYPEELANREAAGKSLFARRSVVAGEVFAEEDIDLLRPGHGAPPRDYWLWLGSVAERDFQSGDALK